MRAGFHASALQKLEKNRLLLAVRQGTILALPLILTGSFALVLSSLPIPAYRSWLQEFLGGSLNTLLVWIQNATNGVIALVFLLTISYSYERNGKPRVPGLYPLCALGSYLAFLSSPGQEFSFSRFGSQWAFYAIAIALLSSVLLAFFQSWRRKPAIHLPGDSSLFHALLPTLWPIACTVLLFGCANMILSFFLGIPNFQEVLSTGISAIFGNMARSLPSALLFITLLNLLWFFGVHGGMALDIVARQLFAPGIDVNAALVAAGQAPTEIFSKTFLDTFVHLGGCGTALCLLIAIAIADRRRSQRALVKLSAVPVLFNINELILFCLPIILNPVYLIPLLCTPVLLTLTSYFATASGLVPIAINSVEWTTPILLSGFVATGSLMGSLLQLFNLALGTACYIPFVRAAARAQNMHLREQIDLLTEQVKEAEQSGQLPTLLNQDHPLYTTSHSIADDFEFALSARNLSLHYQPQIDADGRLAGAEALLRWEYLPNLYVYPPLLISLVNERNLQRQLADFLTERVCADFCEWRDSLDVQVPISFNLTAVQLMDPLLPQRILSLREAYAIPPGYLGIELTEQAALSFSPDVEVRLQALRGSGVKILVDDFGMGHSTMMHLQNSHFDVVKLDGSLTRQVLSNPRSCDIIASIMHLSKSLLFDVCAEYVETEEQKNRLYDLGCTKYQGYLYSQALDKAHFTAFAQNLQRAHQTLEAQRGNAEAAQEAAQSEPAPTQ